MTKTWAEASGEHAVHRHRTYSPPFSLASLAVTAVVLTGCAPAGGTPSVSASQSEAPRAASETIAPSDRPIPNATATAAKGFGTFEDFETEYETTVPELSGTLPSGIVFPSEATGEWEKDGRFEDGVGVMQAALFWQCAWLKTYVKASDAGATDTADTALSRLEEWNDLPQVAPHVEETSREFWAAELIEPARAGDETLIREFADGCNLGDQEPDLGPPRNAPGR